MASLGHIAVGFAAGRAFVPRGANSGVLTKAFFAFSALSMLPDADVIAFALGIPYQATFGHRGATHSIGFAVLCGVFAYALAPWLKLPQTKTCLFVTAVVLSHALLDGLTDGGLGVALYWPATGARWFAPVRPIPVAPIGAGMLSGRGLRVLLWEAGVFFPLLLYALLPRRQKSLDISTG